MSTGLEVAENVARSSVHFDTLAPDALAAAIRKRVSQLPRTVDAAANTATGELIFCSVPKFTLNGSSVSVGARVKRVVYIPFTALTSNDTDYATITIKKYTADGATATTVVTAITTTAGTGTSTGSWTAKTEKAFTVIAGTELVEAGGFLTLTIAKAGSGVAVPAGIYSVEWEMA